MFAMTFICDSHLANPLALHDKSLHLGEVVVIGDHVRDDGLLVWVFCVHICRGGDRKHLLQKRGRFVPTREEQLKASHPRGPGVW